MALALAPPAPNPFVARTVLHYALPRSAGVTLRIFDLQGRVVRTLADDATRPAGEYDATWDGRDGQGRAAGAGVYFARLTSDGHTEMREVMLTR
jgi:flagellar hook assembly protein FlgD